MELHSRSTPWATPAQERAYGDMHNIKKLQDALKPHLLEMQKEINATLRALDNDECMDAVYAVFDDINGIYDDLSDALDIAESNHRLAE